MAETIERLKDQVGQQIQASSLYQSGHAWFSALTSRDQSMVKALSILVTQ